MVQRHTTVSTTRGVHGRLRSAQARRPLAHSRERYTHKRTLRITPDGRINSASARTEGRLQLFTHAFQMVCARCAVALEAWRTRDMGIPAQEGRATAHLRWPDDAWLIAHSAEHLAILELQVAVQEHASLQLRPDSCSIWPRQASPPTSYLPLVLRSMAPAHGSMCLRLLRILYRSTWDYSAEWDTTRTNAGRAYHLRKAF